MIELDHRFVDQIDLIKNIKKFDSIDFLISSIDSYPFLIQLIQYNFPNKYPN